MKFLHLIWSNLKRKKLRTLLTLLSIAVAFVLFGFLSAIKQALVGGVEMAGANRLIVRHKVSIIQLLPEVIQGPDGTYPGRRRWPRTRPGSAAFTRTRRTSSCKIRSSRRNSWTCTPNSSCRRSKRRPGSRRAPAPSSAARRRTRFHWKIGDKIPIRSTIWARPDGSQVWEFDIVGIYDGKEKQTDTTALFFRYDYFDEGRGYGKGQVGWYTIRVKDPAQAAEVAKLVDREFENSPHETKTEPEGAFVQAWASQIGNIACITAGILGAVFFTILLVTGNTMSQAVRERTGELGVLKAIGFTNGQVLALVLAESCLLAVLGGALGLGAAWLLIARGDPTGGLLPLFFLPVRDLLLGFGLSLALGLATGFFPALQAMRLRVAEALRRM